ncbi:MAG: T9SS type A sorting domain-containing protein [Ignavibacteriae bacterium]|nr:T9SS type A sorting domain-containing protein [Ignavibacteriota bacterium]
MQRIFSIYYCILISAITALPLYSTFAQFIDSNTVALWTFDGTFGSLITDSSPYHNDGLAYGTSVVPGRFGNARYFNGYNDYIYVPNPSNGNLNFGSTQSFTIEAWFKTTSVDTQNIIRKAIAPLPGYILRTGGGHVIGEIGNRWDGSPPDTILRITSDRVYNDGLWHHAALVRDREKGKLYLYVDGVEATEPLVDDIPFPLANDRPLNIGRWEALGGVEYFAGTLDEIRISKVALHPISATTVAHWHFDEGSGNILHDASPYHNDGVIHNATWVPGRFGSALHFNGLTSYVVLPNSPSLKLENEFTLEAWLSLDTLDFGYIEPLQGTVPTVLGNLGPYPSGGGYQIVAVDNARLMVDIRTGSPISRFSGRTAIPQARKFYHFAATYQRVGGYTILKSYLNGNLTDSTVFVETIHYNLTQYFYIGTNIDGRAVGGGHPREFPGIIDEIRISKIARQPSEFGVTAIATSRDFIDFGLVRLKEAAAQDLIVSNTSFIDTLHVDSINISNPRFSVNTVGFSLDPLSVRTVEVRYSPTQTGVDTGTLMFIPSNFGVAPATVRLQGEGFTLIAAPIVHTIRDVPNDQGRQVRVTWFPSIYDSPTEPLRVNEYSLWRRVDDRLSAQEIAKGRVEGEVFSVSDKRYAILDGELWDFIVTVPAVMFEEYAYVAPTLYNATRYGIKWSVFKVAAHTTTGEFFFSKPDSGYSIDNIFPPPPLTLEARVVTGGVLLSWSAVGEPDLQEYNIYRSTLPSIISLSSSRIGSTSEPMYYDFTVQHGSTYYYAVTSMDSSGNESSLSEITQGIIVVGVQDDSEFPKVFSLNQNYPNPFNPTTVISYGLPVRSRVKLLIFDVLGREIATVVDDVQDAGYYQKTWKLEGPSGIYFYRLYATSVSENRQPFFETGKMLLLR